MSDLYTIQAWLAGVYSNRQQALDQAVWFIPVRLWYLPLPHLFTEGIGFFTEQINEHQPDQFYRSRVLQLLEDPLRLENYKLHDQAAWAGSSQNPQGLCQLTKDDLEELPGCTIHLKRKGESYFGQMKPGNSCRLSSTDPSYIAIEFELTANTFFTLDRGFDATTGQQTWGSRLGPYHYLKQEPR